MAFKTAAVALQTGKSTTVETKPHTDNSNNTGSNNQMLLSVSRFWRQEIEASMVPFRGGIPLSLSLFSLSR